MKIPTTGRGNPNFHRTEPDNEPDRSANRDEYLRSRDREFLGQRDTDWMKGGESTVPAWENKYSIQNLFGQVSGVHKGAQLTQDPLGRQVIEVAQQFGDRNKVSHIHMDEQTGAISVNNATNPSGGFYVTPRISDLEPLRGQTYGSRDEFLGAARDKGVYQSATDVLLNSLKSGGNIVDQARKSVVSTMQEDQAAAYQNYSEVSPQRRVMWANSIAMPSGGQASDSKGFLEETGAYKFFGIKSGSSRLIDLESFEASNYGRNADGAYNANKPKRDSQQGSRDALDYYNMPSPAAAMPKMTAPFRYEGQPEARQGYKQNYLYTLHNAITPEGHGFIRENTGYLRRDFSRVIDLPEGGIDALGVKENTLYSARDEGIIPSHGQEFGGDVSQVEKLLGKQFSSYQGVSVDEIRPLDGNKALVRGGGYVPAAGTSRKLMQKGLVVSTPDESGIIPHGYDVVMGAPNPEDLYGVGERALAVRYQNTRDFKQAFSAYAVGYENLNEKDRAWADENASWIQGASGAGQAKSKAEAGRMFNSGVIGGKATDVMAMMSRDYALSNMRVHEWQDQIVDSATYEMHKNVMIGDKPMFENVEQISGEGASAMYRAGILRDHVIDTPVYDQMQPEFARETATMGAEDLDRMARYSPEMYQSIKAREAAGAYSNPAMDLISAVRSNYTNDVGDRTRSMLNASPSRSIVNLDEENSSYMDFGKLHARIAGEMQGASEGEIGESFLKEVADKTGNHPLQMGNYTLPSAKAALSTYTVNADGTAVSNVGSKMVNALVAQSNLKAANSLGGGEGYKSARDQAAYETLQEAGELMSPSKTNQTAQEFMKKATGITMPVLAGPAQLSKVLAPNEVAMSRADLFNMTNARTEGEQQQILKMMHEGKMSMLTEYFPKTNPGDSFMRAQIRLIDEINAQHGKQMISETPGSMTMSEQMAAGQSKDGDGDTYRAVASASFVNGKLIGGEIAPHTAEDIKRIVEGSIGGEAVKQQERADMSVEDYRAGALEYKPKSVEQLGKKYLDTLNAKSDMGPMYNFGIRGFSQMANLLSDRAGIDQTSENAKTIRAGMDDFAQYPYQAAIDLEIENDPNLRKLVSMSKSLNMESSKTPGRNSAYYRDERKGESVKIEEGHNKNALARNVMATMAGIGLDPDAEDAQGKADYYKSYIAPALSVGMSPVNATKEQRDRALEMLRTHADNFVKDPKTAFPAADFAENFGKDNEAHWLYGSQKEGLEASAPMAAMMAGKMAAALDRNNPEKADMKIGLQSTYQGMAAEVGAFFPAKNAKRAEEFIAAAGKQAPELTPQTRHAVEQMGGFTGEEIDTRAMISQLAPVSPVELPPVVPAQLSEPVAASHVSAEPSPVQSYEPPVFEHNDAHAPPPDYDADTGDYLESHAPAAPRTAPVAKQPVSPHPVAAAPRPAAAPPAQPPHLPPTAPMGFMSDDPLPFDNGSRPERPVSMPPSAYGDNGKPFSGNVEVKVEQKNVIGGIKENEVTKAFAGLNFLKERQDNIGELAKTIAGGGDIGPISSDVKAILDASSNVQAVYNKANQRRGAGMANSPADKMAEPFFNPQGGFYYDAFRDKNKGNLEVLGEAYENFKLEQTESKKPNIPEELDAGEIGKAAGSIEKFTKHMGSLSQIMEGVNKGQEKHIEQSKDMLKAYKAITDATEHIGERGDQASDKEKKLAGLISESGANDAKGAMRQLAYQTAKQEASGNVVPESKLSDEERSRNVMDALLAGGRGGSKRRSKLTADDWAAAEEETGMNRGVLEFGGGFARFSSKVQGGLRAASQIDHSIVKPMQQAMEFYENRQTSRDQTLLQSGLISYDDMMGGVGGKVRQRQAVGAVAQEEFGRQIYNSYGGILNAQVDKADARTAGGLASIFAPAVAGAIGGAQVGPVGAAIGAVAGFSVGAFNYFSQSTKDVQGLADTLQVNWGEKSGGKSGDFLGRMSLGLERISAMFESGAQSEEKDSATQTLNRATNLAILNSAATDMTTGSPTGFTNSKDFTEFYSGILGVSKSEALGAQANSYVEQSATRGIDQEQAMQTFAFQQTYMPESTMANPLFKQMEKYQLSGISVAQDAMAATSAMGQSTTDISAVLANTQNVAAYYDQATAAGVNPVIEQQRVASSMARAGRVNQFALRAELPTMDWRELGYTNANVNDPTAQAATDEMYIGEASRRSTYQGYSDRTRMSYYAAQGNAIQDGRYLDFGRQAQQDSQMASMTAGFLPYSMSGSNNVNLEQAGNFALTANQQDYSTGMAMASGDRLALSMNWNKFTGKNRSRRAQAAGDTNPMMDAAEAQWTYDTIDTANGMSGLQFDINDAERAGIMDYAQRRGLNGMAGGVAQLGAGGIRGAQMQIRNMQVGLQEMQYGQQQLGFSIGNQLTTGGSTQIDGQGFAIGGDGLAQTKQLFARNGMQFNAGNGMGYQQLEDAGVKLSREQKMFSIEQSTQGMTIQQTQFDLAGKQFYEKMGLSERQFNYNTGYQKKEMGIQRSQSLQSRDWQREDMGFQRDKSELSFGWQMEDADRNIRFARGRERLDLMRNKNRAVISQNMEVGQMDRQENRFDERAKWEDESFKRQSDHFKEETKFQKESMEMQKRHFEEDRKLDGQRLEMSKTAHAKEVEWMKQEFGLEDQRRILDRQHYKLQTDMQQKMMEATRTTERETRRLNEALQLANEADSERNGILSMQTRTGALLNQTLNAYGAQHAPLATQSTNQLSAATTQAANAARNAAGPNTQYAGAVQQSGLAAAQALAAIKNFNAGLASMQQNGSNGAPKKGFKEGGYTGDGPSTEEAGPVHKGEYVVPQNGALVVRGDNQAVVDMLAKVVAVLERIEAKEAASINYISTNAKLSTLSSQRNNIYNHTKQ